MRLWHKELIKVLPQAQLVSQWRECCAIAAKIAKHGTPNHLLVDKIMDYPIEHFVFYTYIVVTEMRTRRMKLREKTIEEFNNNIEKIKDRFNKRKIKNKIKIDKNILLKEEDNKEEENNDYILNLSALFSDWHNSKYKIQCYFNIEEKYDCGGVSEEDWKRVADEVWSRLIDIAH